jgi:circadian clock protein KaiB
MKSYGLVLFVTGDAPRSARARGNLERALEGLDRESLVVEEVDLIQQPQRALDYGVFATPALALVTTEGAQQFLYGDLSDEASLHRFLEPVA